MSVKFGLEEWRQYQPRGEPDAPIVLCFGDSWIWYPIPGCENLPTRFNDFGRWEAIDFCCLGENGLEFTNLNRQMLGQIETFLRWEAKTVDMVILSGGGNDLSGPDDLPDLIKKGKSDDAGSWIHTSNLASRIAEIEKTIRRVILLRDTFSGSREVPILGHAYDYAHSTGEAVLWFSPWLKPTLDEKKVPEKLQDQVVKVLIDKLAEMHVSIAADQSVNHYYFVDTRDQLAPDDWANELHPNRIGFQKIAAQFFPEFEKRFHPWVKTPRWVTDLTRSGRDAASRRPKVKAARATGT